jgi:uncharacterized protein (TIGR03118 family)
VRLGFVVGIAGGVAAVAGALYACSSGDPPAAAGPGADAGDAGTPAGILLQRVTKTVLIADTSDAGPQHVDPDLVNAWGLVFSPNGVAWISDNGTGKATLFPPNADGGAIPSVIVPPPPSDLALDADATAAPTGMVLNRNSLAFLGDLFIVSTEDGTISGWQPSSPLAFRIRIDDSLSADGGTDGALYKGLAIVPTTPPQLVAANFRAGRIDVFDAAYRPIPIVADALTAPWVDPTVPAGYAPFNVVTLGQNVYVSYALQDDQKKDDVKGAGHGAVSVFNFNGGLVKSLVPVGAALDSPWGMAIAPAGWGALRGTLLVGNFGAGDINAFNPTTGALVGRLADSKNTPLVIDGLWSLVFGDDADAGISPNSLYFTAGPDKEQSGLYGVLTLAP